MRTGTEKISGVQEGSEEITETAEEVEQDGLEENEDEALKGETATETAQRALKKLKEETTPATDGDSAEKPADKLEEEEAPGRLTAQEKELYKNLPKGLKKAFTESVKNLQGSATRAQQEASRAKQEASELMERTKDVNAVINKYAKDWSARGLAPSTAIASLIKAQEDITHPDINIRKKNFAKLLKDCAIDPIAFASELSGKNGQSNGEDISSHPLVVELKNEIKGLREIVQPIASTYEQQRTQSYNNSLEAAVNDFKKVKDEKDEAGNFRYPELQNDEFLERAKPLITTFAETFPDMPPSQKLLKAWELLTGKSANFQKVQTRLPATNNSNVRVARVAAGSVRASRTMPNGVGTISEVPKEHLKSPTATALYALQQLKQGV